MKYKSLDISADIFQKTPSLKLHFGWNLSVYGEKSLLQALGWQYKSRETSGKTSG